MKEKEHRVLSESHLCEFREHLINEEKSTATVEKYLRDARVFFDFAKNDSVTKELVMAYKQSLIEKEYATSSINSMLAAMNSLLDFMEWSECKVKSLKTQRQLYRTEKKELTKAEYLRLVKVAKINKDEKLAMLLQTICGTGIRVSELKYITVDAVESGEAVVRLKGKTRTILIPGKLKKKLRGYVRRKGITAGPVFITRTGKPLDRSNIWKMMKALCEAAGVDKRKVFPHNLRHLFARCFYSIKQDIAKLADVLGHSSINTTRLYIITSGKEHRRYMDALGLVV